MLFQIMQATGLKRSPFHMEIKVDDRGPCLIEVGARLVGHGNAELCGKMHGDLDLFDLAAHYYLSNHDYGPVSLNWNRYDATDVRYVHGIAERSETHLFAARHSRNRGHAGICTVGPRNRKWVPC